MSEQERKLWMTIRQALLMVVKAIEIYIGVKRPIESVSGTPVLTTPYKGIPTTE